MNDDNEERLSILRRLEENQRLLHDLEAKVEADLNLLSALQTMSIEEHLVDIAPRAFCIGDITDADRRQIATAILDAHLFGTAWLTRDADHGYHREDPLRVEVRDRRMT